MTQMLQSLMQDDFPLTLHHIRRAMRSNSPDAKVTTHVQPGTVQTASFAEVYDRIDRLARALRRLGVEQGDRVGTFAWNNQRHFELYFAVPCVGAVLHTLNIRLFEEQLTYIVNHAEDKLIFVDDSLVGVLAKLAPSFQTVAQFVVMGDGDADRSEIGQLPNALHYEELLEEAGPGAFDYPELDERQAAALCYTSGTTGNPKGVLYSHRSISLHSTVTLVKDGLGLGRSDRVLAVVPMFHANAWGLPHGAALAGADLILPDRFLSAEPLAALIAAERPTLMGCVPTIFADLLRFAQAHPEVDLSSLSNATCGGSAVPRQLMKDFEERHRVRIFQAWGMTETSPVATFSRPAEGEQDDAYWGQRAKQGRPLPWVELRLMDDAGGEVPWDGQSAGEIEVRGPWIAAGYFRDDSTDEKFDAGWLRTGDIAAVDREGFVQITDRSKDVIKTGGEWISTIELENIAVGHPAVAEAAVIGCAHPKWDERPLLIVVKKPGAEVTREELLKFYEGKIAKWWLPDDVVFVEQLPHTATGKLLKTKLREDFKGHKLPTA